MRYVRLVVPILTCFVLASCASTALQGYEGLARPDDETALISTRRPSRSARSPVSSADIVSIQLPHGTLPTDTRLARVLPGETCILFEALVRREDFVDSASAYLCFEADAGTTYALRVSAPDGEIVGFRLENQRTRELVAAAGIVPERRSRRR